MECIACKCKICNAVAHKLIKKMLNAINNEHNLSLRLSHTHNGTVTVDTDEFTYAPVYRQDGGSNQIYEILSMGN